MAEEKMGIRRLWEEKDQVIEKEHISPAKGNKEYETYDVIPLIATLSIRKNSYSSKFLR